MTTVFEPMPVLRVLVQRSSKMGWLAAMYVVAAGCVHAQSELMVDSPTPVLQEQFGSPIPMPGSDTVFTLPQLIDQAEESNPQTRISWEQAKQAQEEAVIARSPLFPLISFDMLALNGKLLFGLPPNLSSQGLIKIDSSVVNPAVKLTYTLLDFGANLAGYRSAKAMRDSARAGVTATQESVALQVTQAYYNLIATKASKSATDAAYDAAKKSADATEESYRTGLSTVIELKTARAQVLGAYASVGIAQGQLVSARVTLAGLVGLKPDRAFDVPPMEVSYTASAIGQSVEELVQTATTNRAELQEANDQVRAAEQTHKKARSSLFPQVTVDAEEQYTYSTSSPESNNSAANSLFSSAATSTNGSTYVVAGHLHWDIFAAGAHRALLHETASKVRESEDRLTQATIQVQQGVWNAYAATQSSLLTQQAAEAGLDAAALAYDAAAIGRKQGLRDDVQLKQARAVLAQAQMACTVSRARTMQSAAQLAYSSGQLLVNGPILPTTPAVKP